MVRLAVAGALGRTGRRVTELALADGRFEVVAALTSPDCAQNGEAIRIVDRYVKVTDALSVPCDVLVDFTLPEGTMTWLEHCRRQGIAMVSGVTGLNEIQLERLKAASREIPVLHATNFSFGIVILQHVLGQLARQLGEEYDVEIVETHHRHKVDAPSGTALTLAGEIAAARGRDPGKVVVSGRTGHVGGRPVAEIGIHAVRMGDIVGSHEVHFSGPGESVVVSHHAHSRNAFASGALRAATWLVKQPPGYYKLSSLLARPQ
jgi:4-hydroxy-tetrahydrodipicolinate reductase